MLKAFYYLKSQHFHRYLFVHFRDSRNGRLWHFRLVVLIRGLKWIELSDGYLKGKWFLSITFIPSLFGQWYIDLIFWFLIIIFQSMNKRHYNCSDDRWNASKDEWSCVWFCLIIQHARHRRTDSQWNGAQSQQESNCLCCSFWSTKIYENDKLLEKLE